MTDNEIIRCLRHCRAGDCENCKSLNVCDATFSFHKEALNLINRQKAEIEQWKEEANKYQNLWCIALDNIEKAQAKAYTRITNIKNISRCLDNLVKEMTEVNENDRA